MPVPSIWYRYPFVGVIYYLPVVTYCVTVPGSFLGCLMKKILSIFLVFKKLLNFYLKDLFVLRSLSWILGLVILDHR